MIDPINFTNFELDDEGLQEYILFAIAVAGKNAVVTRKILDNFLTFVKKISKKNTYFEAIKYFHPLDICDFCKTFGFGCYNLKSKGFCYIAKSGLDLRTCSTKDLEKCPGIGFKTSRFFILHTRPKAKVACLDTHILKWLRDKGFDAPRHTPQNSKQYQKLESIFLGLADKMGEDVATLDLKIWNQYRAKPALV